MSHEPKSSVPARDLWRRVVAMFTWKRAAIAAVLLIVSGVVVYEVVLSLRSRASKRLRIPGEVPLAPSKIRRVLGSESASVISALSLALDLRERQPEVLDAIEKSPDFKRLSEAWRARSVADDGEPRFVVEDCLPYTRDEFALYACGTLAAIPSVKALPANSAAAPTPTPISSGIGKSRPGPAKATIHDLAEDGLVQRYAESKLDVDGSAFDGDKSLRTLLEFGSGKARIGDQEQITFGDNAGPTRPYEATKTPMGIVNEFGRGVCWPNGVILSYHIEENTFRPADLPLLRNACRAAAKGWEEICNVHILDDAQASDPIVATASFSIRQHTTAGTQTYAESFLPHWAPSRRIINISPLFFRSMPYCPVGVLRHELGHVLGFMHEHVRIEAGTGYTGADACRPDHYAPSEAPLGTVLLTKYDNQSVMHLLCGGGGSPELEFTKDDMAGAFAVYPFAR